VQSSPWTLVAASVRWTCSTSASVFPFGNEGVAVLLVVCVPLPESHAGMVMFDVVERTPRRALAHHPVPLADNASAPSIIALDRARWE
jgi:hypothetical protein